MSFRRYLAEAARKWVLIIAAMLYVIALLVGMGLAIAGGAIIALSGVAPATNSSVPTVWNWFRIYLGLTIYLIEVVAFGSFYIYRDFQKWKADQQ